MAVLVFVQNLIPAIILVLYNVIFDESLKSQIALQAPNANATAVIQAGASGFRAIVQPTHLQSVLVAYSNSIDRVFYLVAAVAAMCGLVLWGMGWKDVRKSDIAEEVGNDSLDGNKQE